MISAQRIEWQNLNSLEFDLVTCLSFDSDNGNSPSFLNQDGIYTEHYDGHRTVHRAKKNEFFNPTFTLIKEGFEDFTIDEQRKILSWLSIEKPGWLSVYHDDSNVPSYRCFGMWENIELYKLGSGRVVGYVISFASTHPYAWSRKFTYPEVYETIKELSNNDESNDYLEVSDKATFTLACNTDEYNKLLYPRVTIIFPSKKTYFVTDVEPTKDKIDRMIPNVIYSWYEDYRRATAYEKGKEYYSDLKGTKADPQPTDDTEIKNGEYYTFEDKTHLYVNLNEEENEGIVKIQELGGFASDITSTNIEGLTGDYSYYYFPDDGNYIRKLQVQEDGVTVKWLTVAKAGMAVKIINDYTFDGETKTTETIVAGGITKEEIVLNGTNKVISGITGTSTRTIGDDFNWNWMPLAYGDNKITVMGSCKIKIEWLEPRKVGSL